MAAVDSTRAARVVLMVRAARRAWRVAAARAGAAPATVSNVTTIPAYQRSSGSIHATGQALLWLPGQTRLTASPRQRLSLAKSWPRWLRYPWDPASRSLRSRSQLHQNNVLDMPEPRPASRTADFFVCPPMWLPPRQAVFRVTDAFFTPQDALRFANRSRWARTPVRRAVTGGGTRRRRPRTAGESGRRWLSVSRPARPSRPSWPTGSPRARQERVG